MYKSPRVNEDMLILVILASSAYHRTTLILSLKQVGTIDIALFWTLLATCQGPSHFRAPLESV